jgi:hypothetical protein
MKFIDDISICKGFAICKGHMTGNEVYEYSAEDAKKDTVYSQILFGVNGTGAAYDSNGNKITDINANVLYDFKEYYGKKYSIRAFENGGTWICINPIPANKFYTQKILTNDTTIVGDGHEHVLICLFGSIVVNEKTLNQLQYARIFKDKTANIIIPDGSIAIHLNATKLNT